ncbi:unnamed protein product [Oikopleura dioica]|uniref:RNA 3'-terminal phosphate cyclase n=1 Tax=Oikopleura dioica TaxID=34765 RepID=E4XLM1_OIKDI|nr:unnamed protein product [Oikopleura dioica]
MIEIDGERHEGGGQSVRLAVALSVVLKKSCRIFNIRKKRSRPGLANQHIAGINLVEELAGCEFLDRAGCPVEMGSTSCFINADEINYTDRIRKFTADAHTAGSIALMAQVALPILSFWKSEVEIELKGGTDAEHAPPVDDQIEVFAFWLRKFGLNVEIKQNRRGFFPRGGGNCVYKVFPVDKLKAVQITCPKEVDIFAEIWHCKTNKNTHTRFFKNLDTMARKLKTLENHEKVRRVDVRLMERPQPADGFAAGIYLYGRNIEFRCAYDAQIARNNRNGPIPDDVCERLMVATVEDLDGCDDISLDRHHSDQFLIYAALADGESKIPICKPNGKVPQHILSAIYVINTFLPDTCKLQGNILTVKGVGHTRE